jgi:hypothetical protein
MEKSNLNTNDNNTLSHLYKTDFCSNPSVPFLIYNIQTYYKIHKYILAILMLEVDLPYSVAVSLSTVK